MITAGLSPTELVAAFWTRFRAVGEVDRDAVRALAAGAIGAGAAADAAVQVLFLQIVEPLADSFEPAAAHAFVDAFTEVVDVARHHPDAAELDSSLAELGHHPRHARRARPRLARGRSARPDRPAFPGDRPVTGHTRR